MSRRSGLALPVTEKERELILSLWRQSGQPKASYSRCGPPVFRHNEVGAGEGSERKGGGVGEGSERRGGGARGRSRDGKLRRKSLQTDLRGDWQMLQGIAKSVGREVRRGWERVLRRFEERELRGVGRGNKKIHWERELILESRRSC